MRELTKSFQYACKDACNWPLSVKHSASSNRVTHFQVTSWLVLPADTSIRYILTLKAQILSCFCSGSNLLT